MNVGFEESFIDGAKTAWAIRSALNTPPEFLHVGVIGSGGAESAQGRTAAIRLEHVVGELLVDIRRPHWRVTRHASIAHEGLVQDNRLDARRVCGSEEKADRSALGNSEQCGALAADGIHDRGDVIDPIFQRWCARNAI